MAWVRIKIKAGFRVRVRVTDRVGIGKRFGLGVRLRLEKVRDRVSVMIRD